MIQRTLQHASAASLVGLAVHYAAFYAKVHASLWTDRIAEWIMAHTPNHMSVWILDRMGAWAKPFALTGGLATLGFALTVIALLSRTLTVKWVRGVSGIAAAVLMARLYGFWFEYESWRGDLTFWLPAALALFALDYLPEPKAAVPEQNIAFGDELMEQRLAERQKTRRDLVRSAAGFALPALMGGGVVGVAVESFLRNRSLAASAAKPVPLYAFVPPPETFFPGLVRKAVSLTEPVDEFYVMSKASVDPAPDADSWRLRVMADGKLIKEIGYRELLSLNRTERWVTLRCVSNTLETDLMDTAHWSGVFLSQIIDKDQVPPGTVEAAVIGLDEHGDSYSVDYLFSPDVLIAVGMNGKTLSREHGFPARLLTPRYYGFKHIKWIDRIDFVSKPYFGTWPKQGYTKEPLVNTASYVDRYEVVRDGLRVGGVSFAGSRGIQAVEVKLNDRPYVRATLERPLSPYTWTRWAVTLPMYREGTLQVRAQDGAGAWQADVETDIFPAGVAGPTIVRFKL